MYAYTTLPSPLGMLHVACCEEGLCRLWLPGQQHFGGHILEKARRQDDAAVFRDAARWLQRYFAGEAPSPDALPLHLEGSDFQLRVWRLLRGIPYGEVIPYAALARQLAAPCGHGRPAYRAVGGAVGRNPVAILVPCHRVVGSGGRLGGYAGGPEAKKALLALEGVQGLV